MQSPRAKLNVIYATPRGFWTRIDEGGAITNLYYIWYVQLYNSHFRTFVKRASLILLQNHMKSSAGLKSEINDLLLGVYCILKP